MARVTVEDCVVKVPNRFELVMLAAQRARNIAAGAALTVDRDNDKNPVVALREIADETIELEELENNLVRGLQKHVEVDEPEEDEMDILAIQQELSAEQGEPAPAAEISEDLLHIEGEDAEDIPEDDGFKPTSVDFGDTAEADEEPESGDL